MATARARRNSTKNPSKYNLHRAPVRYLAVHHVAARQLRRLPRMAALAATVTASMAPSAFAKPQRATLPVNVSLPQSTPAPAAPPVSGQATANTKNAVGKLPQLRNAGPQPSPLKTIAAPSMISRSDKLRESRPFSKLAARPIVTRPEVAVALETATHGTTTVRTVVAQVQQPKNAAVAVVASVSTEPAKPVIATTQKSPDERVLLAQLDKELRATESKLKTTDAKLSEGQRQLLGLSNTLRSVMIEEGDSAGLHPFVRVASRYAGTPYVWGGESRYGFDCSGFIIRVMRDLGYKALPHSAAEQFKYGRPVAQSMLRPGDIVFFANTYKRGISHVGIYIGKRRFIHAANTRQGTIVSSLNEPLYRSKYAGARRLVTVGRRA